MNTGHEKIAKNNMFRMGKVGIFLILLALMVPSILSGVTTVCGVEWDEWMLTGSAYSPWPMFRGDARNTGLSPYHTSHNDGGELWRFETGYSVYGSPVVDADGTVYLLSEDRYLYALDPDGTELWRVEIGVGVTSSPVLDECISSSSQPPLLPASAFFSPAIGADGTIYVGVGDTLHILDPEGFGVGEFQIDGTFMSSPTFGPDGTIYITAYMSVSPYEIDVFLYAIYPNGTEKWSLVKGRSPFGGMGSPSPAISPDGTIYFAVEESLYAVDPDGAERWSFHIGPVSSSPAIGNDGTIYIGTHGPMVDPGGANFYAIDSHGTLRWRFETDDHVFSSPAIGPDGTIYFGEGVPIISDRDHYNVYALNPDGTEKWRSPVEGPVVSSPAVGGDGAVYFGSYDHRVYALDPDGTERWNFTTGGNVTSSPAICKRGVVYIGSWDDNLYALGPSTFPVPEKEFVPENLELEVYPTEGESPLNVTITVRGDNVGLLNGSLDVMVYDSVVFNLTIPAEGSGDHTFTYTFDDPGTHTVSFHNLTETVVVTEPVEVKPTDNDSNRWMLLVAGIPMVVAIAALLFFMKKRGWSGSESLDDELVDDTERELLHF